MYLIYPVFELPRGYIYVFTIMSLSQAETDNLDHYTNAYAVFYKDVRAYQRLLEEHDVINWNQVFQIQGEIKCKTLGSFFFPYFCYTHQIDMTYISHI